MNEQEQVNKLNQEPSCDQVSTPMGIRAASPREAILQRLEAEESHCISRLEAIKEEERARAQERADYIAYAGPVACPRCGEMKLHKNAGKFGSSDGRANRATGPFYVCRQCYAETLEELKDPFNYFNVTSMAK